MAAALMSGLSVSAGAQRTSGFTEQALRSSYASHRSALARRRSTYSPDEFDREQMVKAEAKRTVRAVRNNRNLEAGAFGTRGRVGT